jgi:hypothetical protein
MLQRSHHWRQGSVLALLSYVGGLVVAFVIGVGVLSALVGLTPERKAHVIHPRPPPVAEAQQPISSNYHWGPRVAPGMTPGQTEPIVTEGARRREAAKIDTNKSRPKKRHAERKSPVQSEHPHDYGSMALGYAAEPSLQRFQAW